MIDDISDMSSRPAPEHLLTALHDRYNAHDPAAAALLYAPGGRHREATQGQERVGRAAVQEGLRRLFAAMPDVRWERRWLVADAERAAAGYRLTATVAGAAVALDGVHQVEAQDGRITTSTDVWDRTQLAQQLPPRAQPFAFAHLCRPVADLPRALAFYGELGLGERRRFTDPRGVEHVFLGFRDQPEHLELVAAADGGAAVPAAHVGWLVSDLDGVLAGLAARGIRPLAPPARGAAASTCLLSDPDGHEIELVQPAPATT
jgi:catechol 2,3-dioxygenase-like lactoylglutathione lyase family enzyme/predicted ester cyclase